MPYDFCQIILFLFIFNDDCLCWFIVSTQVKQLESKAKFSDTHDDQNFIVCQSNCLLTFKKFCKDFVFLKYLVTVCDVSSMPKTKSDKVLPF